MYNDLMPDCENVQNRNKNYDAQEEIPRDYFHPWDRSWLPCHPVPRNTAGEETKLIETYR